MIICEIRVPTYKRPHLLMEALQSLQEQTLKEWQAMVLDDSPEREGEQVVADLGDPRIHYRPNATNLGCALNLDRAFQTGAYIEGEFACVLEDDNLLLPECLESNVEELRAKGVSVLLRNQDVWRLSSGSRIPTGRTTRGSLFRDDVYSDLDLKAATFFCEGISNGGLFWRCTAKSNMQVGLLVRDSGLQEYCRTVQIVEPVVFAAKPLAVWSEMSSEQSLRLPPTNRIFSRGIQSLRRSLLKAYGKKLAERAVDLARRANMQAQCGSALVDAFYLPALFQLPQTPENLMVVAKSMAKRLFVSDPLKDYLAVK